MDERDLEYIRALQSRSGRISRYVPSRSDRILSKPASVIRNPRVKAHVSANTPKTTGLGGLLGGAIGSALVPLTGPGAVPVGAAVGDFVEKHATLENITEGMRTAKKFFGMGDYELKSNSLIATGGATSSEVQIVPQGNRAVRIIYREYLGDIRSGATLSGGSTTFDVSSYNINPGLVSLCPWFAPIAQQYEQWTPNGVVFEFKSLCSEYSANQALGAVMMATEYDVLDTAYANKTEMLNSAYSNEAKPSQRIVHGVECDPRDNPQSIFYVRAGNLPSGGDQRDYDLATFYVATQGCPTASLILGSLYIHYDITLRKEQLFNGLSAKGLLYDIIYGISGVANATPIPTIASNLRTNGATEIMTIGGLGTTVTMPAWLNAGRWRLEYKYVTAAAANCTLPAVTFTTNCAAASEFTLTSGAATTQIVATRAEGNTTDNEFYMTYLFDVSGPSPVITFGAGVFGAVPLYCWIAVSQVGVAFA